YEFFGEDVFSFLAKTRTSLSVSSLDLMTQKGVIKKLPEESTLAIEHGRQEHAILVVDEKGYYLGDWRPFVVEGIRQVIILLESCLRWFESHLHLELIGLFAKEKVSQGDLTHFIRHIFNIRIKDSESTKEFTEIQKKHLEAYLVKVLGVVKGLE